jgi:hypothetical protein
VWHLEDNPRLDSIAKIVTSGPSSELVLPMIALAEACWMVEHGKSTIANVQDLLALEREMMPGKSGKVRQVWKSLASLERNRMPPCRIARHAAHAFLAPGQSPASIASVTLRFE